MIFFSSHLSLLKKNSGWSIPHWRNHVLFYTFISSVITLSFSVSMFFSYHTIHPDEYYQIIEFASSKLGFSQINKLPWEFFWQIRSWIQPGIFYLFAKTCFFFSVIDPFTILGLWSTFSALFLFIPTMFLLFLCCNIWIKEESLRYAAVRTLSLFWVFPYMGSHPSSELWGMCLFAIAFALFFLSTSFDQNECEVPSTILCISGILLGIAFQLRVHTAIASLGLIAWILYKTSTPIKKIKTFFAFSCTGTITLFVFSKLDAWGYDAPGYVTSFVNYYNANITDGISKKFGIEPFFWYLYAPHCNPAPYLSIPIMFLTFLFWYIYPKNVFTWLTLPFFLIHSLVPHKEVRFLLPILPFCILSIFFLLQKTTVTTKHSLQFLPQKLRSLWDNPSYKIPMFLFWGNQFALFIILIASFGQILSFRMIAPKGDTWIPPIWNTVFSKTSPQSNAFLLKINSQTINKKGYSFGIEPNSSPYSSGLRGFIQSKRPNWVELTIHTKQDLKNFFSKKENLHFPTFIISGINFQNHPDMISTILPIKSTEIFPHPLLFKICSWIPVVNSWIPHPIFLYSLQVPS